MLTNRKFKETETVQEYFLIMREIAMRGNIGQETLFEYVIDDINDSINNKAILYGAKSNSEFKEKLKTYDRIKTSNLRVAAQTNKVKSDKDTKSIKPNKIESRCFNCGKVGHRAKECQKKDLGPKCFKCGIHGHISAKCKESKKSKDNENVSLINVKNECEPCKEIIENCRIKALIDTGSSISVVREDVFNKFKNQTIQKVCRTMFGFGNGESMTEGYFESDVTIDDDSFYLGFYVVSVDAMKYEAIIGRNKLKQAQLKFKQGGVVVEKLEEVNFIAAIDLTDDFKTDIPTISDSSQRERVKHLVDLYEPVESEITNIE